MTRIAICAFGCKVNQYEAEQAAAVAAASGVEVVDFGEAADIHIVHTCAVTAAAVRDSRQALGRAARANPNAAVIATGCAVLAGLGDVRPQSAVGLCGNLTEALRGICGDTTGPRGGLCGAQARTRALVKIQDGCRLRCSYCVVPQARPVQTSREIDDVVREACSCAAAGHKEVVLTGVRITGYRPSGFGREGLAELVKRLGGVPGLERVRLTSLYPSEVHPSLFEAMSQSPNACHHVHLALQSGDNGVLRRMRRAYTAAMFEDMVASARAAMPGAGITTDVICGFPGETEEAFANTRALMERVGFSQAHVFTFSPRPGTEAALMDGSVATRIAKQRTRELIDVASRTGRAFREALVGSVQPVLVESRTRQGRWSGHTGAYVEVELAGPEGLAGQMADVLIEGVTASGAVGRLAQHTADEGC